MTPTEHTIYATLMSLVLVGFIWLLTKSKAKGLILKPWSAIKAFVPGLFVCYWLFQLSSVILTIGSESATQQAVGKAQAQLVSLQGSAVDTGSTLVSFITGFNMWIWFGLLIVAFFIYDRRKTKRLEEKLSKEKK